MVVTEQLQWLPMDDSIEGMINSDNNGPEIELDLNCLNDSDCDSDTDSETEEVNIG